MCLKVHGLQEIIFVGDRNEKGRAPLFVITQ